MPTIKVHFTTDRLETIRAKAAAYAANHPAPRATFH